MRYSYGSGHNGVQCPLCRCHTLNAVVSLVLYVQSQVVKCTSSPLSIGVMYNSPLNIGVMYIPTIEHWCDVHLTIEHWCDVHSHHQLAPVF